MSERPRTPRPRIGITVGDPAGIGPEVVAAALRALAGAPVELSVWGDVAAVERAGGSDRERGPARARRAPGSSRADPIPRPPPA